MKIRTLLTAFVCAIALTLSAAREVAAQASNVTWQILPWYADSDWIGFNGHPALNLSGRLVFEGRPARTVQSFTAPKIITLDVTLDERQANDGYFSLLLMKTGLATNMIVRDAIVLVVNYTGTTPSGSDSLAIWEVLPTSEAILWGEVPFTVEAGKSNRVRLAVGSDSKITLTVNGVRYDTGVILPYSEFQVQMSGWQPLNRWTVRNFRAQ